MNPDRKYINKIQKHSQLVQITGAPLKSGPSTVIPQKGKSKTVGASKTPVEQSDAETLAAIQQSNKLAIANLKQAVNSTGKKLGNKKRAAQPLLVDS